MTPEEIDLGSWLSAALSDPNTCQEFRDSINKWFELFKTHKQIALDELEALEESDFILECLSVGGMENWEYYEDVMKPYFKYKKENYE